MAQLPASISSDQSAQSKRMSKQRAKSLQQKNYLNKSSLDSSTPKICIYFNPKIGSFQWAAEIEN